MKFVSLGLRDPDCGTRRDMPSEELERMRAFVLDCIRFSQAGYPLSKEQEAWARLLLDEGCGAPMGSTACVCDLVSGHTGFHRAGPFKWSSELR